MTGENKRCPSCGRDLASDAPEGLCPACVVRMNFESGAGSAGRTGKVEALPVEEVARCFPEMEVLALLGSGGMGSVYKARQPKLARFVALKVLVRDWDDSGFVERFTREAQTLARLDHPNIVAIHDFGERDGLFYFVMELVDGVTLRELLREGRMKPEQALAIVPPICEALQFAHENGVVHRDIKPENILVDQAGRVKVADFGIARLGATDAAAPEKNLTAEGQVIGTAHYMAPEQVEHPAEVDHRADIYALGVVFYEMLTGELPLGKFPVPSRKVEIDVRLDEVVLRALEKEPGRRYQQASEVGTAVETMKTPPHMPPGLGKAGAAPNWKHRGFTWLVKPFDRIAGWPVLGAGLAVLVATAFLGWRFGIHTDGVLDLHYGSFLPFWVFLAQGFINWACMVLFLLPLGCWLSRNEFRFLDLLGTQALARWPYLPAVLIMGIPAYRDTVEVLSMDLLMRVQEVPDAAFIRDAMIVTALSVPMMIFIVWMVWLMYHGYTRVFRLNWKRAAWSFVVAVLAAETVSKLVIWRLIENFA